jgi:hypothetical protein
VIIKGFVMVGLSDKFNAGIDNVLELKQEPEYMSSMDNWLLVHATRYMPLKNDKGELYIPTTAMATDFAIPRGTIHFTLNHVVKSHTAGSWEDADIVMLLPFQETKQVNKSLPEEVSINDTYFFPQSEKGLLLPKGTHIVRAVSELPDGQLYDVRGNETVYKTENFTPDEIKLLVGRMGSTTKYLYEKYINADFMDYEIEDIVYRLGDRGKEMYESATDKKIFLKEVYTDAVHNMLKVQSRNLAVQAAAKTMGYKYIHDTGDMSKTSQTVAKTAVERSMVGNISDKGHSNSVYEEIERLWIFHRQIMDESLGYGDGLNVLINKPQPLEEIYEYINKRTDYTVELEPYVDAIVKNKPLNLKRKCLDYIKRYKQENNGKLIGLVNKWCDKEAREFGEFQKKLKKISGYKDFVIKLKNMPTFAKRQALKKTKRSEYY